MAAVLWWGVRREDGGSPVVVAVGVWWRRDAVARQHCSGAEGGGLTHGGRAGSSNSLMLSFF